MNEPLQLKDGMVIEIGSYLYEVSIKSHEKIKLSLVSNVLEPIHYETDARVFYIGSGEKSAIQSPKDEKLASTHHAMIYKHENSTLGFFIKSLVHEG